MKNVMVDLETLGTVPGCAILSIGAVYFDTHGLGAEFYAVVNRESCKLAGLHESQSTLEWWGKQSEEARNVFDKAGLDGDGNVLLSKALTDFNNFLSTSGVKVWGNGADFDNAILAAAYNAVSVKQGWGPYNGRCYRTAKAMFPGTKLARLGVHHHALDDAKYQASHLISLAEFHPLLANAIK